MSLTNQYHIKKLYSHNTIDFFTLNYFKTISVETEIKKYLLSISTKTEKNKKINILLQLESVSRHISTKKFVEDYLIEYKINKNIQLWNSKLKNYLLESYQDDILKPSRESPEYTKIESFQLHELTYKIFYEMAIRNEEVKKIMYALNYLHDIRCMENKEIKIEKIACHLENEEGIYTLTGVVNINIIADYKLFISLNRGVLKCVESIDDNKFEVTIYTNKETTNLDLYIDVGLEKYHDNKINLGLPVASSTLMIRSTATGVKEKNKKTTISVKIDNLKSSISPNEYGEWELNFSSLEKNSSKEVLLEKYNNFLKTEEHQIYFSLGFYLINEIIKELETELIDKYLIYPNNYLVDYPQKNDMLIKKVINNAFDIQKFQKDTEYKHENNYFFKEDNYDGYSVYQGIVKDSDSRYNLSTIKQDVTKQVVDYNISNFQINLNLPKEELHDYLSKVKDNYDNDNSILLSPMELLGEKMEIDPLYIKNMDSNKWANVFYNYDLSQYLTYMQNKLKELNEELNTKLKPHKTSGGKTRREKIKIKNIAKEYENEINKIEEDLQIKYLNLSNKNTPDSTIKKYIKFLNTNIKETKYIQYLQKNS
ncbi:MAG: hypothetical protein U9N59_06760 [Campylobacterota bacterium]|nr:hypothetical protein [Campylobacterota bacterium]